MAGIARAVGSGCRGIRKTGYYVGEVAHPWKEFTEAGFRVDVAYGAGFAPGRDRRFAR